MLGLLGSVTAPNASPPTANPTSSADTVSFTVSFSALDISAFDDAVFDASFRQDFAFQLAAFAGVHTSAVVINSISAGSVQVQSTVIFNSATTFDGAASAFATSLSSAPSNIFTSSSFASYGTVTVAAIVSPTTTGTPTNS